MTLCIHASMHREEVLYIHMYMYMYMYVCFHTYMYYSLHKAKLQTIPGSLVVDIVPQPPQSKTGETQCIIILTHSH